MARRIATEGVCRRLPTTVCPFCDNRIKTFERVVKCRNCGEAFEPEPDEEDF